MTLINGNPVRPLWPEAVVVVTAVLCFWGMVSTKRRVAGVVSARLLSIVGLTVTAALVFLGAIWPSYYTIIAIVVFPASIIFGIGIFRPMLISTKPKLRTYLMLSVLLSAFTWSFQIFWELSR